jgi:citrate synthase
MRCVGSSEADPYVSLAAAAAALSGPLHGGANEAVLRMLAEIGSKDNVPAYVAKIKEGKGRLMGFGHRIYKNYDPRARIIKRAAEESSKLLAAIRCSISPSRNKIALEDECFISASFTTLTSPAYLPGHGLR